MDWLREGDRNTAFFHARASARRRTNKIKALVWDDGSRCENQVGIKGMVQSFYEYLFSSEPCDLVDAFLEAIPRKVDDEVNAELCKPYTDDEIKAALFQMGPTKALGPDGFLTLFFQTHWDFFHEEIYHTVRSFLDGMIYQRVFAIQLLFLSRRIRGRNI